LTVTIAFPVPVLLQLASPIVPKLYVVVVAGETENVYGELVMLLIVVLVVPFE
jgi:hypothetical protein